jgi:hypothetical protein
VNASALPDARCLGKKPATGCDRITDMEGLLEREQEDAVAVLVAEWRKL